MKLVVTSEYRFDRTPDGAIWTQTVFPYSFWTRYLGIFDTLTVIARVRDVQSVSENYLRVDGANISIAALPYYIGPWEFAKNLLQVRQLLRMAIEPGAALLFRAPSAIAAFTRRALKAGQPYGVEVVGDPYDVFAPEANDHPARQLFRWYFTRNLQQICAQSSAISYVTEGALQRRYPPGKTAYTTHYSSIELKDDAFVVSPRHFPSGQRSFTIVTVGTLAQRYKGVDTLIDAVGEMVSHGFDVQLRIVGDGWHRQELEAQAEAKGIGARTRFLGQLPSGTAVREQLDSADLFVLPSRQEGLPRAMIEGMARGLPCIGSNVGGIPELLSSKVIVNPDRMSELAKIMMKTLNNPVFMSELSSQNLKKARDYRESVLRKRRVALYEALRDATVAWAGSDRQVKH